MTEILLSEGAQRVLNVLENNGFEAYVVGGCVRDILLGKKPGDFDIATNALPSDIKRCFEKTADTGIAHGTVTVVVANEPFEVTTYRTEKGYSDMRRPDGVTFVSSIEEDLARRDFTVNAMAYNKRHGLCDPFGGTADLKNKILRAVGDPEIRFSEDALRILRLFRFASVLEMDIEEKTKAAAINHSGLLKHISPERIYSELLRLSIGSRIDLAKPIFDSGALGFLGISKLENSKAISSIKKSADLRFYALLCDCCRDKQAVLEKLKASNRIRKYFTDMDFVSRSPMETRTDIKKILRRVSPNVTEDFSEYLYAVGNEKFRFLRETAGDIIKNKEPVRISDLAVTGKDLADIGLQGDEIGRRLDFLLEKVTENPELNRKNILLSL